MKINNLLEKMVKITESKAGQYSLRMVNTAQNGRRIELSKSIVSALELEDQVCITMTTNPVTLLFSKLPLDEEFSKSYPLKNYRTIYASGIVQAVSKDAQLDYSNCSSRCFASSEKETYNGVPVIIFEFN